MALSKFEKDMQIIQALDDEPNDVGGLTSAELKAKFDEGGEAVKQYINDTLIQALDTYIARTDNPHAVTKVQVGLGLADNTADVDKPVSGPQQAALQSVVLGQIPDESLTMAKMAQDVIASLSNKAEFDDGFLQSGSIKSWAESKTLNTNAATNTNVTDLPYPGFWGVNFYYYPAGGWRVLIATDIQSDKQFYTIKNGVNPWVEWKTIATATPPTEYDLPLANGWAHINADDPLTYGKCGDGRVQITGIIIAPAGVTTGQQIATLPAGYRPVISRKWLHAFDANTGIDYAITIGLDGTVKLWVKAPPTNATLVFPVQLFYGA